MRDTYKVEPPYYSITVKFKPKGVESYNASEIKKVNFEVNDEKDRETYYKKAKSKVVKEGIISEFGIEYWEPYQIDIDTPTPPSEVNHLQHY